jgi:tetratricopeptide (TPR) repeat protein
MTIKNGNARDSMSCANRQPTKDWFVQLQQLSDALVLCPTDLATRCELAALLEQLGQHEEALVNWNRVLTSDPNNLLAREGSARCRQRMGRSLHSPI